ncbi:MAG: chromosome segregation protein SMC, partial [Blautia sp.]
LEGQINVLNEQLSAGEQNREHYESRLLSIAEELSKKEEAKKEQQEEGELLKEKTSEMKKKMKKKEEALSNIQENIRECSAAVEDGKNEIIEILNTRATTKGKAQRFDTMMEQIGIRKAELSQKILKLKSEEEEQSGAMNRAAAKYEAITALIEEMNEECNRLNEEVFSIQEQLKNQNGEMEAGQAAYHREASRLDSLKNMAERYDGYGNSIRRVMEQKERVPGIEGVVADLIQVNKDYEIAIETALGGSIQNIVTDNEQTAKQMIEFLKKNRFGRATFLPLSSVNARGEFSQKEALKEEGVIGLASELVNAAPRYQGVIRYLLGRVLVVDHIDHAIAIGRKYRHTLRMVTIEGESLSPGGSMTGGAFRNNSNLLGRKREIEELEKKVCSLKTELEEMQKSIDESRSKRNVIRDTIADFKEKLRLQYIEQNTAKMSMNQLEEKNEQIQRGYLQVQRDQMDMQRQVREVQEDHSRIKKELEESQKDEKELETFIETRQQELDEWKNEESEALKELEHIRLEVSSMGQKTQFTMENLSRLSSEISSFIEEKEKIRENLKLVKEEMEKKRKDISNLKNTIANFDEEEKASKDSLKVLIEEKEERNKSHKAFFEKRDALSSQMSLLDKECFRLKSQAEKIEENREAQISYMWEEYEITPNNALQYKKEELTDRQEMQKEIGKIKEEIRCLGTVNVNAIEDYKELLERHTFLSNQYEDLQQAEKTLEQIIEELDEGMRKQFSEKFREIQREFDKAFKELFGGGKGTLELSEDEDILEAGIRIISQPPGKKLQNMMQLSGGEKALTAIALLFAIQNLKPSPFCLLDEIEAALDDSNVGRFAGYLQKLTKNTQFIIITHRRGTMNAADRLYGITMQEKGVSTLVSVDLVENQLTQ